MCGCPIDHTLSLRNSSFIGTVYLGKYVLDIAIVDIYHAPEEMQFEKIIRLLHFADCFDLVNMKTYTLFIDLVSREI